MSIRRSSSSNVSPIDWCAGLPDPDWRYTAASARAEAEKIRPVRYDAGPQPRIEERGLRELQAVTRMMHDAGVKLLAGTDVSFINAPGFSLHDELDLLVAAGLPPAAALRAATSNPAAVFPKLETGSIAPGRRADLVLLDANPLTDIRNARRIRAVDTRRQVLRPAGAGSVAGGSAGVGGKEVGLPTGTPAPHTFSPLAHDFRFNARSDCVS